MRLGWCPVFVFAWVLNLGGLWGKDLRIVSYNVENDLPMVRLVQGVRQDAAPKPEKELSAVVQTLVELRPDIIGLMEIGGLSQLGDLQTRLKAAGVDLPYRELVEGADPERHLALLSRFPITAHNSSGNVAFDFNGRAERMLRGILDVTIEISPEYHVRLVGAHLKSRREAPGYSEEELRRREAHALRLHLDDILATDRTTNLLLFGDLNDTKNSASLKEILGGSKDLRLRDIWLKDGHGETWTHFWRAADTYSRIDYFAVSPGLFPEVRRDRSGIFDPPYWDTASDHRAIYLTLSTTDQ